ncbi:PD-(D/E)XK nuclease family protein [Micromonospora sp. NPDC049523]|uniref:PD-(D/E)XK nuclease family protein n=1 Tax=Micromonospora sp. NPDC049523 TaxID=3155921 RepID=UPI003422C63D
MKPAGVLGTGGGLMAERRALGVGSHPEALLCSDELRVKGRVDLINVTAERADIVDHKTGAEDPSHLDQLRFYAMLWDQDEVANQDLTPVGALAASYPTAEVMISALSAEELVALATNTGERVRRGGQQGVGGGPRCDARGTLRFLLGPKPLRRLLERGRS